VLDSAGKRAWKKIRMRRLSCRMLVTRIPNPHCNAIRPCSSHGLLNHYSNKSVLPLKSLAASELRLCYRQHVAGFAAKCKAVNNERRRKIEQFKGL
jgi:hypothetical protein